MVAVYSYSASAGVAQAVGEYIVQIQDKAIAHSGSFSVAISGGSLGKVLKAALVEGSLAPRVQWDKWRVYFSDERLVPLDHADSNCGLFNEMVVKHLAGPKPEVHPIDTLLLTGKDGAVEGSDRAQDEAIAAAYAKIVPHTIDLVLLGCGPDGHTCSLFPNHAVLQEHTQRVALVVDLPKPPPRRVTLTFPVLAKAGNVAFVAEGSGKAPVLREIFAAGSKLPSAMVNRLEVPVSWFVDDAALEGVSVKASKYVL